VQNLRIRRCCRRHRRAVRRRDVGHRRVREGVAGDERRHLDLGLVLVKPRRGEVWVGPAVRVDRRNGVRVVLIERGERLRDRQLLRGPHQCGRRVERGAVHDRGAAEHGEEPEPELARHPIGVNHGHNRRVRRATRHASEGPHDTRRRSADRAAGRVVHVDPSERGAQPGAGQIVERGRVRGLDDAGQDRLVALAGHHNAARLNAVPPHRRRRARVRRAVAVDEQRVQRVAFSGTPRRGGIRRDDLGGVPHAPVRRLEQHLDAAGARPDVLEQLADHHGTGVSHGADRAAVLGDGQRVGATIGARPGTASGSGVEPLRQPRHAVAPSGGRANQLDLPAPRRGAARLAAVGDRGLSFPHRRTDVPQLSGVGPVSVDPRRELARLRGPQRRGGRRAVGTRAVAAADERRRRHVGVGGHRGGVRGHAVVGRGATRVGEGDTAEGERGNGHDLPPMILVHVRCVSTPASLSCGDTTVMLTSPRCAARGAPPTRCG
jgi:hypothetical protein